MTDIPDTMHAATLQRFGGPEELSLQEVDVPSLDPDELLIRIHTAGVGVWDAAEREGMMKDWVDREIEFPYILGSDGAGTVVDIGDDVSRFDVGDRVYAAGFLNPKGGFYAEYAAAKEKHTNPLPEGSGLEEGGVLAIDGVTALRGLRDELEVDGDDTVLVFGASGGVGHLAVQLARRMGARVIAVASGTDGVSLAADLDADAAVDGHDSGLAEAIERLAPNGLDAALVTATGDALDTALAGLRENARVAWPNGVQPAPEVPHTVRSSSYDGAPDREILDELNRLVESGPFVVHVDRTFPLADAEEAHRALDAHYLGKLALRVEQ